MWITCADMVKREFVRFYNKLFHTPQLYLNTTDDENLDSQIDLTKHHIRAVENFNYEGEEYPVIVVGVNGGELLIRDFGDEIGTHSHIETLGTDSLGYEIIGNNGSGSISEVAVKFQPSISFELEEIKTLMSNATGYAQGDITVYLYEGGDEPEEGTLMASGVLDGFSDQSQHYTYFGFSDKQSLDKDNTYWLRYTTDSYSRYNIFIDTDDSVSDMSVAVKDDASSDWSVETGKAVVGTLRGNSAIVFGGDVRIPVTVQIAGKDAKTVDAIFDISLLYTELAKKTAYGDFYKQRIRIDKISFGGDTAPQQFRNQLIFIRSMTVNVIAAWTFDVSAELLREFGYDISVY